VIVTETVVRLSLYPPYFLKLYIKMHIYKQITRTDLSTKTTHLQRTLFKNIGVNL